MNGDALKAFFQRKFIHNSNSFSTKRECLEMNKMEPARNINLPPTLSKTATATTSVSSFIFLSPITIFQSHSWFAWSCLPQSSQRWSQIKARHSMWLHNSCSRTARERRALRKDRVWCANGVQTGAVMVTGGHQCVCSWQQGSTRGFPHRG